MSITSIQGSPSRVKHIEQALHDNERNFFRSYQDKIDHYVGVISHQKEALPEVSITTKKGGCISISDLCSAMSCCFRSKCCTTDIKYYYMAEAREDQIKVKPKPMREAPTDEENKLTNLSFFIELYHEQGEYLSYLMRSAIDYLPTAELKQYWKSWDPESTEPLDREKANLFRGIMKNARKIMEEIREEMMRSAMRKEMLRSSGFYSPSLKAEDKKLEKSLLKIPKHILEDDKCLLFDEEILKKDVKKICKCNPRELNLVVNLVLKRLPDVCTKQGIWNVMMEVIAELELQIKSSKESEFFQEVEFASSKCQAEKVIDLPTADFATLMKIKETEQKGGLNKIQKAISRSFSTRAANTSSLPRSPRVEDLSNLSQDERPSCLDQEESLSRIHISYV